jgi:hypothetical protein
MTRREWAHARAVNEYEAFHDSPDHWLPFEREQFGPWVAKREAVLLVADVTDPESYPADVLAAV